MFKNIELSSRQIARGFQRRSADSIQSVEQMLEQKEEEELVPRDVK